MTRITAWITASISMTISTWISTPITAGTFSRRPRGKRGEKPPSAAGVGGFSSFRVPRRVAL